MAYTIRFTLVLAGFWLLLSGHYNALLLALGAASVALVAALTARMNRLDGERPALGAGFRFPRYILWLSWEIVKANLDVARRVWSPGPPIEPTMVRVGSAGLSPLGKAIYANSITLTPGTVSVRLEDDSVEVHALTRQAADELLAGAMERRVRELKG